LFLEFLLTENYGLHAGLVKTVGLGQIKNVELDLGRLVSFVYYLEVVPLGVPLSVKVVLQPEIVLYIVHFRRFPKIARLKSTIED